MSELSDLRIDYDQLHAAAEAVLIKIDEYGELDERDDVFTVLRTALYGEPD